jgi:hypothetical protein
MPIIGRVALVLRIEQCAKALASAEDDLSRTNAVLMIRFLRTELAELDLRESPSKIAADFYSYRKSLPFPVLVRDNLPNPFPVWLERPWIGQRAQQKTA